MPLWDIKMNTKCSQVLGDAEKFGLINRAQWRTLHWFLPICTIISRQHNHLCSRLLKDSVTMGFEGFTRLPCTTVCITSPWDGFPRSIARRPRGCPNRTIRLRKTLGEKFSTPTFLAPTLFQLPWRYVPTMENRPRGVSYTSSYTCLLYTSPSPRD